MTEEIKCSFCLRPKDETKVLIQSVHNYNKYICDQCVAACNEMIKKDEKGDVSK